MPCFHYRRGDGNEGNYHRAVIALQPWEDPYAALIALVANDYQVGKRVRRHILKTIETDGEPQFSISATCYEGPDGERAFEAAWLTAELIPLTKEENAEPHDLHTLKEYLDRPAFLAYQKRADKRNELGTTFEAALS